MDGSLDYAEAVRVLDDAVRFGVHPSLDGIRALTEALGMPQSAYSAVQVAGTNGKTSVARMVGALLEAHGEKAGVFVSPRLGERTSQFIVGGRYLEQDAFARAVSVVVEAARMIEGELTEFELSTAVALIAFLEAGVTWAVLEVGMGGRWDSTSVVTPRVSAVTGIDLDHTDRLGATREAIAGEKAAILRAGSRVILGPGVQGVLEVFMRRADEVGASLTTVLPVPAPGDVVFEVFEGPSSLEHPTRFAVSTPRALYDRLEISAPRFQVPNVAVAIAAVEGALNHRLDEDAVIEALASLGFPGRFEVLATSPYVITDGAHNPSAAAVLALAIEDAFSGCPPLAVVGILEDKDATGIIEALSPAVSGFIATKSSSSRSLDESEVASVIEGVTGLRPPSTASVADAMLLAGEAGLPVIVTGSLTVAAEARVAMGVSE